MTVFGIVSLLGGLAMFLFGMSLMGNALERRAGNSLKVILGKLTSNKFKAFLLGLGVTAIIQSSSATTVMVVGFVNSGVMQLKQAISVIMGANLGTSVTSWLLSLTGIEGNSLIVNLFKPTTLVPVIAFVGIIMYMFVKDSKKKEIGMILLGFAVLMFGMETMSDSVKPLAQMEGFRNALVLFSNPVLGMLMGVVVTAVIQSSSASVGILQALTMTGSVSYATAIPIIMGQNIGTCVSALISSAGASKNAKRAAFVHLYFNLIATAILLPLFYIVDKAAAPAIVNEAANPFGIAVAHTAFKLLALAILMPLTGWLEKLAQITVKEGDKASQIEMLDERLMATPAVAVEQSRKATVAMAQTCRSTLIDSMRMLFEYDEKIADRVRDGEEKADMYEDKIGSYLIKLSMCSLTEEDSRNISMLLHLIGDFERLSDHALNILESAEEMRDKKLSFSGGAKKELETITAAATEIVNLAVDSFVSMDISQASVVEPLEQVIDYLKLQLRNNHVERLRKNECTIEQGFVFSDLLTNLERVSDHCSNIAVCVIETSHERFDMHEYLQNIKADSDEFDKTYNKFFNQYSVKSV